MNNIDYTDTYIFDFNEELNDEEYVKSCSTKTKKKDLRELIEQITNFSTKKIDDTLEDIKNFLGL